jgi:hypothetical protein
MGSMDRDYQRRFYHFPRYKLFMQDWDRVILDYVRRLPDGPLRWAALKESREEGRSKLLLFTELRYGLPMMPIDFWYDKPHITTKQVYLDFIFGQSHFNYESGTSVSAAATRPCAIVRQVTELSSGCREQLCRRQVRACCGRLLALAPPPSPSPSPPSRPSPASGTS